MAFLNKLLINTMIRAAKSRDPKEVAARQLNSSSFGKGFGTAVPKAKATKSKKGVPDYSPMPGTDVNYGSGGFLSKISPAIRKAIMDGPSGGNRGPKTGFGGLGMGGGTAVPSVKGERSNLPPMSLAEILARRNIDFNPFQSSKQGLPSNLMPPQGQPMPPQGQPPQAQPQPEMVNFLSKLVQQGVYPNLATAFRATMSQPNQSADMGAPMGDRGPSGIASMLPLVAGRLFGGGR